MKHTAWIALLCILLAYGSSAIVSRTVFERLPHLEDEFAYLYQARIFAHGDVAIATPLPRRAYWQPFLIDVNGQRAGKYPPGWPLLLAGGAALGQPWIVNAWLVMLTVALVYRLGRALFSPPTGAVAAILTSSSPAALLLDGTLMAHTAALFWTTLLLFALWRVEKTSSPEPGQRSRSAAVSPSIPPLTDSGRGKQRPYANHVRGNAGRLRRFGQSLKGDFWAGTGGLALGMLIITRPLTGLALAVPLAVFSTGRAAWIAARHTWRSGWRALRPLLILGGVALAISLIWPAFNYAVSARRDESFPAYLGRFVRGDADTNLYLRVWPYDRVGFGAGHGRAPGGHTLALGWAHTRADLRCAARDLFGWAAPPPASLTVEQDACLAASPGFSWLLLPVGLVIAARRRWTWYLLALPVGLIAAYAAYWIGGGAYSARYYFESLTAVTLLSAAGFTGLAAMIGRAVRRSTARHALARSFCAAPYALLGAAVIYTLVVYAPARLRPLRGVNHISQAQIARVDAVRRDPALPVVVIVRGDHHWYEVGALMAVTSPYLDSDIVLARDPDEATLQILLKQWWDRDVLYYVEGQIVRVPPDG